MREVTTDFYTVSRSIQVLTKIKKCVLNTVKQINDSYEFKPLLSEIEDSPVSPLGRFTFWTIVSLIIVTALWLFIGKIDIVVSARGIVIPEGDAKIIQPLETGIVKEILVKEGDFVYKNQLLIHIDPSTTDAQLENVKRNLEQTKLEAMRLKSGGNLSNFPKASGGELKEEKEIQEKLYRESLASLNSEISAKNNEIKQLNMQISSTLAQKRDYEFQLKSAIEREEKLAEVLDIIEYNKYRDAKEKTNSLKESLNRTDADIKRFQAQVKEIENNIAKLKSDFKAQNLTTLSETQKRINELSASKESIEFSNKNQKITAPCDGYIDKLFIHTIGGVVTPAQELIALTPADAPVVIKATVLNRDIGFINVGMPVSIKIDTYDFQKYGILKGTVKSISQNSIEDDNLGPIYEIYIKPENDTLLINGKEQKISTGMTLNAEIEIGERRIIEFFIYPLIKYLDEGISVR